MLTTFLQDPPALENSWRSDAQLRGALARRLPPALFARLAPGLDRLGERAAGEMLELAREAERDLPRLVSFDPWGRRIDRIEVAPAWRRLHAIAAEEGVVAAAYDERAAHGAHARLHQLARLYLFHPSSAIASCPLAMTDGAARVLELHGAADLQARFLPHLLARDPARFWTSGQWMTETTGGSDVSDTETVARPDGDGYRLTGLKWFTSATTAEIALALARIAGAPAGNRGLTLFLVELAGEVGQTIRVLRLKDKLGTRALPTAELELDGVPARRVGEEGRGVATVATMLNVTRLYNTTCAAAGIARGLALATDYARRRRAFGQTLATLPLHRETLADLAAEGAGALALVLRAGELFGREECGVASAAERAALRLLTPLAKLTTGRQAVAAAAETLESFGGAGYVEDTGLPALLRDAQVLAIWEGTTNVLALDALRAIAREGGFVALDADLAGGLARIHRPELGALADRLGARRAEIAAALARHAEAPERLAAGARDLALALGRLVAAVELALDAEAALIAGDGERPLAAVRRFARRHLGPALAPAGAGADEAALLLGL